MTAPGVPWGLTAAALGVRGVVDRGPPHAGPRGAGLPRDLFEEVGFAVWDGRWYAGHQIPGYSLLFPPLAALVGVRAVGALAVLASATAFERIATAAYGRGARWGAVWFALAALGDVWSGRVTFALGVSFALAAVLALGAVPTRGGALLAGALAAVCAACSPVAGVLLGLAGLTHSRGDALARSLVVLGVPSAIVVWRAGGAVSGGRLGALPAAARS